MAAALQFFDRASESGVRDVRSSSPLPVGYYDPATGAVRQPGTPGNLIPKGYQKLSGLSAAQGLAVPQDARVAVLRAEGQDTRWRDDGQAPTATDGIPLRVSDQPYLYAGSLPALRIIEITPTATVHVAYYG